jgi:hypothetical protein
MAVENAPPDQPHTISQSPPQPRVRVPVRMDPKHPLRIGADYYPDASRRANEMGRCVVQVTVAADGRIIEDSQPLRATALATASCSAFMPKEMSCTMPSRKKVGVARMWLRRPPSMCSRTFCK